mmetsp:Transcript_21556/g.46888  ORF Transcript_21556/g.46888 Transcript_21556/m.46888 type:complete len:90 (+) Transcript_21556:284-553(+)
MKCCIDHHSLLDPEHPLSQAPNYPSLYDRSTYFVVMLFANSIHSSSFNTQRRFSLIAQSHELCAKGIDCAIDWVAFWNIGPFIETAHVA